jgi:hypothetical protein
MNTLCKPGTETSVESVTMTQHPISPRCAEQLRVVFVPAADLNNWSDLPKFGDFECDETGIESLAPHIWQLRFLKKTHET